MEIFQVWVCIGKERTPGSWLWIVWNGQCFMMQLYDTTTLTIQICFFLVLKVFLVRFESERGFLTLTTERNSTEKVSMLLISVRAFSYKNLILVRNLWAGENLSPSSSRGGSSAVRFFWRIFGCFNDTTYWWDKKFIVKYVSVCFGKRSIILFFCFINSCLSVLFRM